MACVSACAQSFPYPAPFIDITGLVDGHAHPLWRAYHPGQDVAVTADAYTSLFTRQDLHLTFRNSGYRRSDGEFQAPGTLTSVEADHQRLLFTRENVSREIRSGAEGFKHTYIVHHRPEGPSTDLLILELATSGNAKISRVEEKSVVFLSDDGRSEWIYDALHVTDAKGKVLPGHFRAGATAGGIEIHINDEGAAYPIAIDPLFRPLGDGGREGGRDTARLVIDGEANIVRVHDGLVLVGVPGYDLELFGEKQIHDRAIGGSLAVGAISYDGKVSLGRSISGYGQLLNNYLIMAGVLPAPRIDDVGVVYAYKLLDGRWTLLDALNDWQQASRAYFAANPNRVYEGARFGESISIGGGGIAVGAPGTGMELWYNLLFGQIKARKHVYGAVYLYNMPGSLGFSPPLAVRGIERGAENTHEAHPQLGKLVAVGERHAIATSGTQFEVLGEGPTTEVGSGPTAQTKLHHFVKQGNQWVMLPTRWWALADWTSGIIDIGIVGSDAYVLKQIPGGISLNSFPCHDTEPTEAGFPEDFRLDLPGTETGKLVAGRDFLLLATPQSGIVRVIRKSTTLEVEEIRAPAGLTGWGEQVAAAGEGILISGKSGETQRMYYFFRNAEGAWTRVDDAEVPFPGGLRSLSASSHTVAALGRAPLDANKSELRLMPFDRSISGTAYLPDGSPAAGRTVYAIPQEVHAIPAFEATLFDGANFVPSPQKPWRINRNYGCGLHFFVPDAFPFIDTFKLRIRLGAIPAELQGRIMVFHVSLPLQSYTWGGRELFDLPAFGSGRIDAVSAGEHEVDLWWGGDFQVFARENQLNVIGDWMIRIGISGNDLGAGPHLPIESADLVLVESKRSMSSDRSTVTDALGNFRISGLAPASYTIQPHYESRAALAFPFRGATRVCDLYRQPIHAGERLQLLGNYGIHGTVRIQGQDDPNDPNAPSLPGVEMRLTRLDNDIALGVAVTDNSGDYVVDGLEQGSRHLKFQGKWGPSDGSVFTIPVSVNSEHGRRDVTLPPFVPPATLQVLDASGAAAPNVSIRIRGPFGYDREATTDFAGMATMPAWNPYSTRVYPGVYTVTGASPHLDWSSAPLELTLHGGDQPAQEEPTPILRAIGSEVSVVVTEAGETYSGIGVLAARLNSSLSVEIAGVTGRLSDGLTLRDQSVLHLAPIRLESEDIDQVTEIVVRHYGGSAESVTDTLLGRTDIIYELTAPDGSRIELGPPVRESRPHYNSDGDYLLTTRRMSSLQAYDGLSSGEWRLSIRYPYPVIEESIRTGWAIELKAVRHTVSQRRFAMTDSQGIGRFPDLSSGNYLFLPAKIQGSTIVEMIAAEPGKWRYPRKTVVVAAGEDATVPVSLIRLHSLGGTVNGSLGPVPGVRVMALHHTTRELLAEAVTDHQGAFSVEGVPSGDVELIFERGGYEFEPAQELVWTPLRRSIQNIGVQAFESVGLSGVVTAGGTAVPGHTLRLVPADREWTGGGGQFESGITRDYLMDVESSALLENLKLEISASHMQSRMLLIHPSGRVIRLININSEARGLQNLIFDDSAELPEYVDNLFNYEKNHYRPIDLFGTLKGLPIAGTWRLRVDSPMNGTVDSWKLRFTPLYASGPPSPILTISDGNGRISFSGLQPGFYSMESLTGNHRIQFDTADFELASSGTATFSASVEYPELRVRIVDQAGAPAAGATVRIEQADFLLQLQTDENGEAGISLPTTESGSVSAWMDETATSDPRTMSFAFDEEMLQSLELTLLPRAPASAGVVDPEGERTAPHTLDVSQLQIDSQLSGRFEFHLENGPRIGVATGTASAGQTTWSALIKPELAAGTHRVHWRFTPEDVWRHGEVSGVLEITVSSTPLTIHHPEELVTVYNGQTIDLATIRQESVDDDFEDAEGTFSRWTFGGSLGTSWLVGNPTPLGFGLDASKAPTGTKVIHTSQDPLPSGTEHVWWLRSPEIDLTGSTNAHLSYSDWRFGSGINPIQVSVVDASTNEVIQVVNTFYLSDPTWRDRHLPLPQAAIGRKIIIEFRMRATAGVHMPVWQINNFDVTSQAPPFVTTTPSGIPLTLTYNGSSIVPTNAGTYEVVATSADPNYTGSSSFEWTIEKLPVTIHYPDPLTTRYNGEILDLLAIRRLSVEDDFTDSENTLSSWEFGEHAGALWKVGDPGSDWHFAPSGVKVIRTDTDTLPGNTGPVWILRSPVIDLAGARHGTHLQYLDSIYGIFDKLTVSLIDATTKGVIQVLFDRTSLNWDAPYEELTVRRFEIPRAAYGRDVFIEFRLSQHDWTRIVPEYQIASFEVTGDFSPIISTDPKEIPLHLTYNGSPDAPVDPGTYTVVVTPANPNHQGVAQFEWNIEKIPVTVTWSHNRAVYDGNSQIPSVITRPAGIPIMVEGPTEAVNAGNYEFTATVTDPLYSGSATLTLVIERAPQALDFPPVADRVYGDPSIVLGSTLSGGEGVTYELIQGEGEFDGEMLTFTPLASGDFLIEAREAEENPNYLPAAPVRRSFRVDRREVELNLSLPIGAVYNGREFAAQVVAPNGTLAPSDWLITYNGDPQPPSDAGTYAVLVSGENSRYRGSASGEFTIARKSLNLQAPTSLTYTGEPLTWPVDGIPQGVSFTSEFRTLDGENALGDRVTHAGSYRLRVQVTDPNHEGSLESVVEVVPADAVISVTPTELVYDGQGQLPEAVTEPAGLPLRWELQRQGAPVAAAVDAGVYHFQVFVDDPNFTGSASGSFEVGRAGATISFGSLEATYSGAPQLPVFATEPVGLAANKTITREGKTVEAAIDAGIYEVEFAIDDPNYVGSATATWTILPAALEIFWTGTAVTYNAQPRAPVPSTVPADVALRVTGPVNAVNAGNYEFTAVSADPNYSGQSPVTLMILPAPQVIVFPEIANQTYGDGAVNLQASADSGRPVSYRLIEGGGEFLGGASFLPSRAGTFVIEAREDAEETENFLPAEPQRRSFAVALQEVEIVLSIPQDALYSGNAVPVTAEALDGSFAPEDWTITYNGIAEPPVNAGSYEVLAFASNDRYQGSATGTLVISPLALTIVAEDALIYQPTPQAPLISGIPAGVAYRVEFFTSDEPSVSIGSTVTNAGSYRMVVTLTDGNYSGGLEQIITVSPAEAEIVVSTEKLTYNGQSQKPAVTTVPSHLPLTWTLQREGEAVAHAVEVGIYEYFVASADSNYAAVASGTFEIRPSQATLSAVALETVYDGTTQWPAVLTSPPGLAIRFSATRDDTPAAPTDAGVYQVSVTVDEPSYSGTAMFTWTVQKAPAVIEWITPEVIDYRVPTALEAVASSGEPVTFEFVNGTGELSGDTLTLVRPELSSNFDPGPASVRAVAAESMNFRAPPPVVREFSPRFTAPQIQIQIDQVRFYTGHPIAPKVTTNPAGLDHVLLYRGEGGTTETVPSAVGVYTVQAIAEGPGYYGRKDAWYRIAPASATITVTNLDQKQVYDGTLKSPTIITDPPGLAYRMQMSDGSGNETPIEAGIYHVTVEITDPSYQGWSDFFWVIDPLHADFSFPEAEGDTITRSKVTGDPVPAPIVVSEPSGLPYRLEYSIPEIGWTVNVPQDPGMYSMLLEPIGRSVIAASVYARFVIRGVRITLPEAVNGVVTREFSGMPIAPVVADVRLLPEGQLVNHRLEYRGIAANGSSYGPSATPPTQEGEYWIDVISTHDEFPVSKSFVLRIVPPSDEIRFNVPLGLEQGDVVDFASLLSLPQGTTATLVGVEGPVTRNGTAIWGAPADPALLNLPAELQQGWVDLDLSSTRGIAALANGTVVTWGAPDSSNIQQLAPAGTSRVAAGEHEFAALNHMSGILAIAGLGFRPEVEIDEWVQGSFRDIKAGHSFFLAQTRGDDVMTFGTRANGTPFPAPPWGAWGFLIMASGDMAATWDGSSLSLWGDGEAVDLLSDYPEEFDVLEIHRLLLTNTGGIALGYDWGEYTRKALFWGDAPQKSFPPYSLGFVEEAALGDGFAMLINPVGGSNQFHLWGTRDEVVNQVPAILSAPGTQVTALRASEDVAVARYTTPDYRVSGTGEVTVRYRLSGGSQDGLEVVRSFSIAGAIVAPTVAEPVGSSVLDTRATLGGSVTDDGGAPISERGIVFSATADNADPLIGGSSVTKVVAIGTTGDFTVPAIGLSQGTGYSFKAYAINSVGITYTSVATFTTLSTNADLSALSLSRGTLNPGFAAGTTSYTAIVDNASSITLTPTAAQSEAKIEVRINTGSYAMVLSGNSSSPLPLNVGANLIEVRVTAQAGNSKSYTVTLTRGKASQVITFSNPGPQIANATVNLSATGGASGNPVDFTVEGPAALSFGNLLSFTGDGFVTIRANQAGDDLHHPAPEVVVSFTVTKATATVTLGSLSQIYDGTPKSATATTDPAGKTVAFTYDGGVTAPTNAGSYEVVGSIDDPIYQGSATGTLVVAKATQTLAFAPIPDQLTTDTVNLSATGGGSSNPVTFAVTAGPATISNGMLSFAGAGSVTVTASQAGNANYEAAPDVPRIFTVTKATGIVTLGSLNQIYDGTPKSATATTDPGGKSVVFTYDGSASAPTNAGSYEVVGTIDDPIYQGSTTVTLVIAKAAQTISFPAIADQLTTDTVNLAATGGGSVNPVTFVVTAGPATISNGALSITGAGSVTITASQAGDANHEAAPDVSRTFSATKATATVTLENLAQTYDGTPKVASATTSPEGKMVVLTYDGGTGAPVNAGSYEVVGTIEDPIYQGSDTGTLVIAKASQAITFAAIPDQLTTATVNLTATGGASGNPVAFAVTSGPATITGGGQLAFTGAGSVTVTASQAGNANYEAATPVARTFNVSKASATVNLGSLSQTYDGSPRSATATTAPVGKAVAFTYDGSSTAPTNAGSYGVVGTIDDPIYQGSATGTLVVAKASQTINFPAIPEQFANATLDLFATGGGSGNAVTFAVTAGPASISNGVLSFSGTGNVTISANQAGNANYEAAPEVSRTLLVRAANATVSFGDLSHTYDGTPKSATATTDPAGKTVVITYDGSSTAPTNAGSYQVVGTIDDPIYEGGSTATLVIAKASQAITFAPIPDQLTTDTVNLSATGGASGNPVTFAVTAGPATMSNGVLSFTGAGSVTITASQAGNGNYEAAPDVPRTFTVTKAVATVTLGSLSQTYDGTPRSATALTNPAGKTVVFAYDGGTNAPVNAGTYEVVGTIDDAIYQGSATGTLVVGKAGQTITFAPIPGQLATDTVNLSATGGGSGNRVTFAVTSGPATITGGNQLSFTGAGSVTITASQLGNDNYETATPVPRTFIVTKASATVTLGSLARTYDGTPKAATATTDPSGKTVTFTYDGSSTAPGDAGSYEVIATINDPIYQGSATGTLVISKASQTIIFAAIADQLTTDTVNLAATGGGSGNAVTFAVTSGPATISNGVLSFTGAGAVTVTASQAGNANYEAAPDVPRTFTVTKASATVTLGSLAQTYDGTPKAATATTTPAGKTVTFTYDGSSTAPTNAGTYEVVGTIDDAIYQGSAKGTLVIGKAAQAILFANPGPREANTTVNLTATGGASGNPVTFTAEGPAKIEGSNLLGFTGPGSVTVRANQAGNANYEAAPEVAHTFTVTTATATLTLSRLHQVADGTAREAVVTTDPTDLEIGITYDGGTDAPTAPGSYAVVASSADARYAASVNGTLVVDDPARFVVVPGGSLPALSALGDLAVPTFRIGAYEVTGSQWAAVVAWAEAEAGYNFNGAGSSASGDRPVTGVSWSDAAKWCNARTEWENTIFGRSLAPAYRVGGAVFKTGTPASPDEIVCDFGTSGHRLPTAAEWEFAARGGNGGTPATYPGGNTLDDLGWVADNSEGGAQPAGGKTANDIGLFDLAGNAAEWTWDAPAGNTALRLLRGGSWSSPAVECSLDALNGENPALLYATNGFRLARSVSLALTGALDHPQLTWDFGGPEPWFAQTGTTHDGEDAAESAPLVQGETGWLETTVEGPGNLRFQWKTEGSATIDVLSLSVGGAPALNRTGTGDWEEQLVEIGEGTQLLRWTYVRGSDVGEARAWLDAVEYVAATEPSVTTAAASEITVAGASLGGEVTGDGGREVTARGVVYAIATAPTLESGIVLTDGEGGIGTFSVDAVGLAESTGYFARAYATNNLGTTYGEEIAFTTGTSAPLDAGVATVSGSLLPGDNVVFHFSLDGPRVVSLAMFGGAVMRVELYDSEGNLIGSFTIDGGAGAEEEVAELLAAAAESAANAPNLASLLLAGDYTVHIFREEDGDEAQTFDLTIDASTVAATRPDVAVGSSAAVLQGGGSYAPAIQVAGLLSKKAKPVTGYASLSNRGNLPDVLAARSTGGNAFFSVSYFDPAGNITAGLLTGSYRTAEMDENTAPLMIRATITPNKKKLTKKAKGKKPKILKKRLTLSLQANSTFDPGVVDAAAISIQTK